MFYYKPLNSNPPAPPLDPQKTLYREQSKYTDPRENAAKAPEPVQEEEEEEEEEDSYPGEIWFSIALFGYF